jgi:hypothetical protein
MHGLGTSYNTHQMKTMIAEKRQEDWPSWICPTCFRAYYILPPGIKQVDCGVHHTSTECCHYGEVPINLNFKGKN